MKRLLFWILLLVSSSATAVEVAGVQVPEHVTAGGVGLRLNGAGIRTRLIFKVYVGALYLKEKKSSPAEVIAEEIPSRSAPGPPGTAHTPCGIR